ncbi:MAG TPA: methyltransferase type 11, partial [Chloroflexota bacterium]|nr:methyltransferase type 11 [Chloroflexota bacterium]
ALPFSLMGRDVTREILAVAQRALRPGGTFLALQYHPWYLPPLVRECFGACERHPYVWNVPPALLLRASA